MEQSSQEPHPKQSSIIKERLHLHVKRRLHNDQPFVDESLPDTPEPAKNRKLTIKKLAKTHKPYKKKKDTTGIKNAPTGTDEQLEPGESQRRNKRILLKQASHVVVPSGSMETTTSSPSQSAFGDTPHLSGAGDDDGSQEGCEISIDSKTGAGSAKDKEKTPDVLGLVLNMKKYALLCNSEVQDFLSKVIKVVKDYTDISEEITFGFSCCF